MNIMLVAQNLLNHSKDLADLTDNAYVITIREENGLDIQGDYSARIVAKYLSIADFHVDPTSGYIIGSMRLDGLAVNITLT